MTMEVYLLIQLLGRIMYGAAICSLICAWLGVMARWAGSKFSLKPIEVLTAATFFASGGSGTAIMILCLIYQ